VISVTYRGRLVAAATAERTYVSAPLLERGTDGCKLRFVLAMCLYAMDVDAGVLPGPHSEDAAAMFARACLMPRSEFAAWLDQPDDRLAGRFGVPVLEVGRRRQDLARPGRHPSAGAGG
jgi:hypothetical protein